MSNWPDVLGALLRGENLTVGSAAWAMNEIMDGQATDAQIAAFAVGLRAKGETVDELEGLVAAMYSHATPLLVPGPAVDVVGTGGDRSHSVNISTMAAIVAAAAGARVVKHGNRAASSACGSADLLEELGIVLDLPADEVASVAIDLGITFCFAPRFHPALRYAAGARREIGAATTFNFLGPLANPARPSAQAVGVADARMAGVLAGVLARRGVSALVFRGEDGLDELTTTTTSRVWVSQAGEVTELELDPLDLDLPRAQPADLRGGDAPVNAGVARAVLAGEHGPVRDAVLLNAAAALVAYQMTNGSLIEQLAAALPRAAEAIDSGSAAALLDQWVASTQERAKQS